ncbi:MAG: ribosome assembly RNA-binding protein YhbY [Clostridia bacterium]|nr:ribosome assembly RNA-binding protein YhbY [Clostridia bacterium]
MITSKQRAFLRGLANKIDATVQVGKGGINENMVKLVCDTLEKHELIKVHVLENSFSDTADVCHELARAADAEEVQVIGSKFVLYKESRDNKKINLNKLTVKTDEPKRQKNSVKPLYKAKAIAAKERKRQDEEKKKRDRFFKEKRRKSYSQRG